MRLRKLSETKKVINYALVDKSEVVKRMTFNKRDRVYQYSYKEYTSLKTVRAAMLADATAKPQLADERPTLGGLFPMPFSVFGGIFDNHPPKPDPLEDDTIDDDRGDV